MPQYTLPQLNTQGPDIVNLWLTAQQMKQKQEALDIQKQQAMEQHEINTMKIYEGYMKRAENAEDVYQISDIMAKKWGMNPELLPKRGQFQSEDQAKEYILKTGVDAGDWLKYKQGGKVTFSKLNDDGTKTKVVAENYADRTKYESDPKWVRGEIEGTPTKTLKRIEEEAAAKKSGELAGEPAGGKPPKTEWEGFFKNNPNATESEIVAFGKKIKEPKEGSDFEKGYKAWEAKPENKGKAREEYKRTAWEKPQRTEMTPGERENRVQHEIKTYGAPTDQFGKILLLDPAQKKAKLTGLIRARDLNKKAGSYEDYELDRIDQAAMTSMDIPLPLQNAIRAARMAGGTAADIEQMILLHEIK